MEAKLNISVLCGGQSAEHEISLLSASNVIAALDPDKYQVTVVYITQEGQWLLLTDTQRVVEGGIGPLLQEQCVEKLMLMPGNTQHPWCIADTGQPVPVDCVVPVLHGTKGEDGTLQGLLEMLNVAYVGAGVLSSAVCMEKHITKRLLRLAGLPTPDWLMVQRQELAQYSYEQVVKRLGPVVFVKPSGLGSSVGISKVTNQQEFHAAIAKASRYDDCLIIESYVTGREIECSVLGNHSPVASLPGEIILHHEFYSYEAKYVDPAAAEVKTPADLPEAVITNIRELAVAAFKTLHCIGMARIDFFVKEDGTVMINEVNTIPGFTNISMYSKNWQASGLPYPDLIDRLIHLGIEHHQEQQQTAHIRLPQETMLQSQLLDSEGQQ